MVIAFVSPLLHGPSNPRSKFGELGKDFCFAVLLVSAQSRVTRASPGPEVLLLPVDVELVACFGDGLPPPVVHEPQRDWYGGVRGGGEVGHSRSQRTYSAYK